jgi:hypothetical protein
MPKFGTHWPETDAPRHRVTARLEPSLYQALHEALGRRTLNDIIIEALQQWLVHPAGSSASVA